MITLLLFNRLVHIQYLKLLSTNKGKILYIITDCNYPGVEWTIVASGGSLINCSASLSSTSQISGYMLCSDGTNWQVINTRRYN